MTDGGRGEQLAWHGREDVRAATSIMRIIVNLIAKNVVIETHETKNLWISRLVFQLS